MKAYVFFKQSNEKEFLFSVEGETIEEVSAKIATGKYETNDPRMAACRYNLCSIAKAFLAGKHSYSAEYETYGSLFVMTDEAKAESTIKWIAERKNAREIGNAYPERRFHVMDYLKTKNPKSLSRIREVYPEFV